jgi:lipid II:glycine glycyltransferase (peptidoglycan interpeptide bridge formation enzyme)
MDRALAQIARRYRAIAITWEPPVPEDGDLAARLARRGLRSAPGVQARATRRIDLRPSMEEIAAQQHHKWRYNIRLARKHGVQVREARSLEDVARWYAVMRTTAERDAFGIHDERYYRRFWLETAGSGATALLLAEHEGKLLGGVMVHRFGSTATYLYGASSNEARQLMPNHLLQWEAMRWARERGAAWYDLFGIADDDAPDHPLAGVTRFKTGFGGQVVRYIGAFDRVYHPALYVLARRMRGRD